MGCAGSRDIRQSIRRSPLSFSKSFSDPTVNDSARKSHSFHVTSLSFSSPESVRNNEPLPDKDMLKVTNDRKHTVSFVHPVKPPAEILPFEVDLEIINAWELMDGLEDTSPLRPSFVSNVFEESRISLPAQPPAKPNSSNISPSTSHILMQPTNDDKNEIDLHIIGTFPKGTNKLSSEDHQMPKFGNAGVTAFQEKIDDDKASFKPTVCAAQKCPPDGKGKLVLYFTSLRVVRKTFEDCWNAKIIIQGYGFRIDERDISIHAGFKEELEEILGHGSIGTKLPMVFANGKYLGGVKEVVQMHEAGELVKALKDCEVVPMKKGWSLDACEVCCDVRFVLCGYCSGSCRVFVEEDGKEGTLGFQRCPNCNENGLVRCHSCCF